MPIINRSKNEILMYKVIRADNPLTRMAGLNGTDQVNSGKTLHIVPCSGIHTFEICHRCGFFE